MFRTFHFGFTLACALGAAVLASSLTACGSDNKGSGTGSVSEGETAVTKYVCTSCHGPDLSGTTTPYAGTTTIYPPNLTPDESGLKDWSSEQIVTTLLTGKDDDNAQLCSPMPVFSTMGMTMAEATAIATYLKSLPAVAKMVPESTCAGKM